METVWLESHTWPDAGSQLLWNVCGLMLRMQLRSGAPPIGW